MLSTPVPPFLMRWFDPTGWLELIDDHRADVTGLVPSMVQILLARLLRTLT